MPKYDYTKGEGLDDILKVRKTPNADLIVNKTKRNIVGVSNIKTMDDKVIAIWWVQTGEVRNTELVTPMGKYAKHMLKGMFKNW